MYNICQLNHVLVCFNLLLVFHKFQLPFQFYITLLWEYTLIFPVIFCVFYFLPLSFLVLVFPNEDLKPDGHFSDNLGMSIVIFSIFLMSKSIQGPPCLQFTVMKLYIALRFFTNSTACLFSKLNNFSSGPYIKTLKIVFHIQVYSCKRLPLGLVPPPTFGFSQFTIGCYLIPNW